MGYRFSVDKFGRFIFEHVEQFDVFFNILYFGRGTDLINYKGSIPVVDLSNNIEMITYGDEVFFN